MQQVSIPKRKRRQRLIVDFRYVNDSATAIKMIKAVAKSAAKDTEVTCTIRNNKIADESIEKMLEDGVLNTVERDGQIVYDGNLQVYPGIDPEDRVGVNDPIRGTA